MKKLVARFFKGVGPFVRPESTVSRQVGIAKPTLEGLEERITPTANIFATLSSAGSQLLRELTPDGTLVSSTEIPPGGPAEAARDLVVGENGKIHVFNGTDNPYLSTYDPTTSTWSHLTHPGWSTSSSYGNGGIGALGDYVFVSDQFNGGAGLPRGIVRFDLTDGSSTRFGTSYSYTDLSVGLNGLVYGLSNRTVHVYNPSTMALQDTINLPYSVNGSSQIYRAITVDASGELFVSSWQKRLFHFDSAGNLQNSTTLSNPPYGGFLGDLIDIDVSPDGTLVAGGYYGDVVQMNTDFTNITYFEANTSKVFVTFGPTEEAPTPNLSINNVSVTEGNTGTTTVDFTVSLLQEATETVTVDYATADGTASSGDYVPTSGSLTFAPGETDKTVSVTVNGDIDPESDEVFYLNLSHVSGANLADDQGEATITNDDVLPSISVSGQDVTEGDVGTTDAVFTITLSQASSQTVTVDYTTDDFTAHDNVDFVVTSGTLTFAPGETSKTVVVPVIGDTIEESDEMFFLDILNPTNATISFPWATTTIHNDDVPPPPEPPELSVNDAGAVEEQDSGVVQVSFTVLLSEASSQTVSVNYATEDGSATAGSDYTSTSGTLTFAPGEVSKTVTVNITPDVVDEGTESFSLTLSAPTNAILADGTGTATITDDDDATLSVGNASVNEGDGGTTTVDVTITLSNPSDSTVTVDYATEDGSATAGSDYVSASGTLTFAPGETSKTVSLSVLGDEQVESDEAFTLNLSNAGNAGIAQGVGTITLANDDNSEISIGDVSVIEGNAGSVDVTFNVTLSEASPHPVSVDYASADGTATSDSDYTAISGTLDFAVGEVLKTITVTVQSEVVAEMDETFWMNLSNATGAIITDGQGQATIENDDQPDVSVNDVTLNELDSGTREFVFTVSLHAAVSQVVAVDYATANGTALEGSDYTGTTGTLTFAPGETSKTVLVTVSGDLVDEGTEVFYLNLVSATFATITDNVGVGTIQNDDVAKLSVSDVQVLEGDSGTTPANFVVTLSNPSTQTITVDYHTSDIVPPDNATSWTDYNPTSGTLTFAPGETSKTVTVNVLGDSVNEVDELFFFQLSNPTNASLLNQFSVGVIENDDIPSVSIDDATVTEGDNGFTHIEFTVHLSEPSDLGGWVDLDTGNGTADYFSDLLRAHGRLYFDPGESSVTLTVTVVGDHQVEGDEYFYINLVDSSWNLGDAQAVGTIVNDDLPPVANAGTDQATGEGYIVTFDGSGSSSQEGGDLTYAWDFGDGSTGSGVGVQHVYADQGVFTATLTVTDMYGNTSTDTTTVTAYNIPPFPELAIAPEYPVNTAVRGQAVPFNFEAFDESPVDTVAGFTFTVDWGDGQQEVVGSVTSLQLDHAYEHLGTYDVRVRVTDKDGEDVGWSYPVEVNVVVAHVMEDTLRVAGGNEDEDIRLVQLEGYDPDESRVVVILNGIDQGSYTLPNATGSVVVEGRGGDDSIHLDVPQGSPNPYFTVPTYMLGGDGMDWLDASLSSVVNVLVGGDDVDHLFGGSGRDLLFGGADFDLLHSGGGEDLLLGDATVYDNDLDVLALFALEWGQTSTSYAERVAHLEGSLPGGLNDGHFLTTGTVLPDGIPNDLFGEGGTDWFVVSEPYDPEDDEVGEIVTLIYPW